MSLSKWFVSAFAVVLFAAPGCASEEPADLTPEEIVAEESFLKNAPPAKAAAQKLVSAIQDSTEVDGRFSKEVAEAGRIEGFWRRL
jgi:hypothetical protein